MSKEITIKCEYGSIEHAIHEYRKSGRKCAVFGGSKRYMSPFFWIESNEKYDGAAKDTTFIFEPITKPISAEDVRKIGKDHMILPAITEIFIKELELEDK